VVIDRGRQRHVEAALLDQVAAAFDQGEHG
jgi:hypothetical protein